MTELAAKAGSLWWKFYGYPPLCFRAFRFPYRASLIWPTEANVARAQKQCGPLCRTRLAAEAAAQADVEAGRRELLSAESKVTTDSPLQAPVWLLPAALDVVAFMAIWTGLSGHRPTQAVKPVQTKRRARKGKPRAPRASDARAQAQALFRRTANDNVVPFQAASGETVRVLYWALTVVHG